MASALDELVEEMAALLGAPCTLEDPDFRLIAFSDQGSADALDAIRRHSILQRGSSDEVRRWFDAQGIREAEGPLRIPGDASYDIAARLCVPARFRGRVQGWFWLLDPHERIDPGLWPEAARIAESAAELLNLVERRQQRRDLLFRELVQGGVAVARQSALELTTSAGLDVHEPIACVLVRRPELAEQLSSRPGRAGVVWARPRSDVCAAVVRASLLPDRAAPDVPSVLGVLGLGRRLPGLDDATRVGIGPVVDGIDRLASSYSGATVALRVAGTRPGPAVVDWSDLGPLTLLGVARDDDLAWALVPDGVRAFLQHASPDLVATANAWLDAAGSVARTAEQLAVHRQTVYHRVAQVEHLTGLDLDRGEDRLRLHLALRLAPYVLT